MELRQLRYFVRIVDDGSVTRASQSLHVAQPALSQQVSRLEEELGVKLLVRSVRGVTPTEAGMAVYRQAQRILKQVEATALIATQVGDAPAGPVTIGLPWTLTSVLGLALLQAVRRDWPAVRLEVIEGPSSVLTGLLVQGKLDLAVVFDNSADGGLTLKPLVQEALMFIGPRGTLAGVAGVSAAQAAEHPLLLLSRPNGIREAIEQAWARAGVRPQVVAEINAPALLIDAVAAGLGCTVLPVCGITPAQRGRVDVVPIDDGALTRTVYLGSSRLFPPTPAAEQVRDRLEALIDDAVREGRWEARWVGEIA